MLTRITPETSYFTHVLPYMVIMSSGLAFVFIPVSSTALHGVGGQDAGVASALINTSQQIGGSLGTALLNTIAATATVNYANARNMDKPDAFAFTHGYTMTTSNTRAITKKARVPLASQPTVAALVKP